VGVCGGGGVGWGCGGLGVEGVVGGGGGGVAGYKSSVEKKLSSHD